MYVCTYVRLGILVGRRRCLWYSQWNFSYWLHGESDANASEDFRRMKNPMSRLLQWLSK